MKTDLRTVRFWTYENGSYVRITLRPGQRLSHTWSYWTEYGSTYGGTTWEYDSHSRCIHREWHSTGKDCDGRLDRYGEDSVSLDAMLEYMAVVDNDGIRASNPDDCTDDYVGPTYPDWEQVSRRQRDHFAERLGY